MRNVLLSLSPEGWRSAKVPAQMTYQQKSSVWVMGGGEQGYSTLHVLFLFLPSQEEGTLNTKTMRSNLAQGLWKLKQARG